MQEARGGMAVEGQRGAARPARPPSAPQPTPCPSRPHSKQHFAQYGEVRELTLPRDRASGRAKGHALVLFEAREEAEAAVAKGLGSLLLGQPLGVAWAFVEKTGGGRGGKRRRR